MRDKQQGHVSQGKLSKQSASRAKERKCFSLLSCLMTEGLKLVLSAQEVSEELCLRQCLNTESEAAE